MRLKGKERQEMLQSYREIIQYGSGGRHDAFRQNVRFLMTIIVFTVEHSTNFSEWEQARLLVKKRAYDILARYLPNAWLCTDIERPHLWFAFRRLGYLPTAKVYFEVKAKPTDKNALSQRVWNMPEMQKYVEKLPSRSGDRGNR